MCMLEGGLVGIDWCEGRQTDHVVPGCHCGNEGGMLCRDALGVSTRSSAGAGPSGMSASEAGLDRRMSSRGTPRSMSSGALVEVGCCAFQGRRRL